MSRAMLACDGPSSALTQPAETRPGAEVWSEPSLYPFITLEPWRCHFLSLCLLAASEICSTETLPVTLLTDALWIIFKGTYKNTSSKTSPRPSAGRSADFTLAASGLVLATQWARIQAFLWNLRGSSNLFSVAFSKCVFANRYPCVLTCQQVNVNCTSASTVSPRVPRSVWGASSRGI